MGELFRMDMENADDIRLNAALFKVCLNDKRRFCPDVFPGNGRAQICLEEHMHKPDFTSECKCAPPRPRLMSATVCFATLLGELVRCRRTARAAAAPA